MPTLYHYCSNAAFHSIIENRSVRLSSLSLSNDTLEGKLVSKLISQISKDDGMDDLKTQRILTSVSILEEIIDGLGFCLSEEGDLLSQWRGYADDACGVSIGFSKDYLLSLSDYLNEKNDTGFSLQKVEYEKDNQISIVKPAYEKIKKNIERGALKPAIFNTLLAPRSDDEIENEKKKIEDANEQLRSSVVPLFSKLFLLKAKAFKEEKEWRLLSYLLKDGDDGCLYRADGNKLVPYREFKFWPLEKPVVNEIILGPKNITPDYVVKRFMKDNKFEGVDIRRSEASYR